MTFNTIASTPFENTENKQVLDQVFNSIIPNIDPVSFKGDVTMLSTLRALLYNRCNDRNFCFRLASGSYQISDHPGLYFVTEVNLAEKDGWRPLKDVELFIGKAFPDIGVFLDEEKHRCAVYAKTFGLNLWHFLQLLIPRFLPWYFEEKPLTDDEKEFLKCFVQKDANVILEAYQKLYDKYFASAMDDAKVEGFIKAMNEASIRGAEHTLNDIKRRIERLMDEYKTMLGRQQEEQIHLLGLKESIKKSNSNELAAYIKNNENIQVVNANDSGITIIAKGYLDQLDSDIFEEYIDNEYSFLNDPSYEYCGMFDDSENRELLMRALFSSDAKLKLRTFGWYKLSAADGVSTCNNRPPASCKDDLPNPHLWHFSCLGEYRPFIDEFIFKGDYIGAIDQCLVSVRSLNISEDCTVNRLLEDLFTTSKKCIELPDGTRVTPAEALDYV